MGMFLKRMPLSAAVPFVCSAWVAHFAGESEGSVCRVPHFPSEYQRACPLHSYDGYVLRVPTGQPAGGAVHRIFHRSRPLYPAHRSDGSMASLWSMRCCPADSLSNRSSSSVRYFFCWNLPYPLLAYPPVPGHQAQLHWFSSRPGLIFFTL